MTATTLKARLARYIDSRAFTDTVPNRVKHTCANVGKTEHDKLKARREIALKRADAAIRFFIKDENFALLADRRARDLSRAEGSLS